MFKLMINESLEDVSLRSPSSLNDTKVLRFGNYIFRDKEYYKANSNVTPILGPGTFKKSQSLTEVV